MDRGRGGTSGGGRGRQARQSRGGRVARLVQGTRDVPVDEVPPSGIPLPQVTPQAAPQTTTQVDIAGTFQVLANLLQQQATNNQASYFERFRRVNPPTFDGGPNPLVAIRWIKEVEKLFAAMQYPPEIKLGVTIPLLQGNAEHCYQEVFDSAIKVEARLNESKEHWSDKKRAREAIQQYGKPRGIGNVPNKKTAK
nr:probable leucine-rich repeat receptor-like protein kinase At1g35710 [Ipomoea batatas]